MSTANKIQLVSNRIELAKDLLLQQFKNKPNINALLEVLINRLQELENNLNDIQQVRTLEGAYGTWLDAIGEEAGVSRGDYMDNDYKTAIKIAYARRSSSAAVDDILRIVMLLTNDDEVTITNPYPYYLELCGYLWCVKDSLDGLKSVAKLFPVNTGVRILSRDTNPFTLDTDGSGIGQGTLCSLIYHDYGDSTDPRFTTSETAILPPVINVPVKNVSAPYIAGSASLGSTLSLNRGVWDGDSPITYTQQWLRDGANISGQTGLTYTIVNDDLGKNISCQVTASNPYGSQSIISNFIFIENVVPPTRNVKDGLGLTSNLYTLEYVGGSASAVVRFKQDGSVETVDSQGLITSRYLNTGVVGDGYSISYVVVSGEDLISTINPNQSATLTSNIEFQLTVNDVFSNIATGTYDFTVRSLSDPTDAKTKRLSISVEVQQL